MAARMLTPVQKSSTSTLASFLLRFEGLTLLGTALVVYGAQGFEWWPFVLLLLLPDLAALGYLINIRAGNLSYNLAHTIVFPLGLAVVAGLALHSSLGLQLALIWLAHIGMDRTVGYGLKDAEAAQ